LGYSIVFNSSSRRLDVFVHEIRVYWLYVLLKYAGHWTFRLSRTPYCSSTVLYSLFCTLLYCGSVFCFVPSSSCDGNCWMVDVDVIDPANTVYLDTVCINLKERYITYSLLESVTSVVLQFYW